MIFATLTLSLALPLLLQTSRPSGGPVTRESKERAGKPVENPVLAEVGSVKIRQSDVLAEINRLIPLNFYHGKVPVEKMESFRDKALQSLIERALIHQDALASGLRAGEEEIRATFEASLKKAGPKYSELPSEEKAKLLETYRPLVERRVLIDKNEARFEASLPKVKEEAVRATYEARKSKLLAPREGHFLHILLKVDPGASEAEIAKAKEKMLKARKEILGGRPFAEVAKEISQDIYASRGGDMGWVKEGSFLGGPVGEAAFKLEAGELSELVSSIYGFHLVQCLAWKPRKTMSFEEARKSIEIELEEAIRRSARERWLATLRERFPVKIHRVGILAESPKEETASSKPASRPGPHGGR